MPRMGQGNWCPKGWEHGKFILSFPLTSADDAYPTTITTTVFVNFRIKHDTHEKKTNSPKRSRETTFWENVRPANIRLIYDVYRMDFELFDYNPSEYFSSIGLPGKAEEVRRLIEERLAQETGEPIPQSNEMYSTCVTHSVQAL